VTAADPVGLLFGGMDKLGPGANEQTLQVLRLLPQDRFELVVDAGCGTGRQTIALARALGTPIDAVDSNEAFLDELVRFATAANVEDLIRVHCMDMKDIPLEFRDIDLLWSEGAAYNIGLATALASWATALRPDGLAVVSELSWLKAKAPDAVTEFFRAGYPDMQSVQDNVAVAQEAGYEVLATHELPRQAWVDGYYDVLALRARALLDHADAEVRAFAAETVQEIDVFNNSDDSYGYVFYVLRRD
jgi:SAM-dependent methyltransferase